MSPGKKWGLSFQQSPKRDAKTRKRGNISSARNELREEEEQKKNCLYNVWEGTSKQDPREMFQNEDIPTEHSIGNVSNFGTKLLSSRDHFGPAGDSRLIHGKVERVLLINEAQKVFHGSSSPLPFTLPKGRTTTTAYIARKSESSRRVALTFICSPRRFVFTSCAQKSSSHFRLSHLLFYYQN